MNCYLWLLLATLLLSALRADELAPRLRPDRGYAYQRDVVADVPWSINIIRISRTNALLELHTTLGNGHAIGLATLSEHIARMPKSGGGRPVAEINGDYFVRRGAYGGDPESLQILEGELVSAPVGKSCFWLDPAGDPHITNVVSKLDVTWPDGTVTPIGLNEARTGDNPVLYTSAIRGSTHTSGGIELMLEHGGAGPWLPLRPGETYEARVSAVLDKGDTAVPTNRLVLSLTSSQARKIPSATLGARLKISTATFPDLRGVRTAIGGGPAILRGGQLTPFSSQPVRHPRSAVGWNRDYIFFVQVDGRQRALSVGMTLPELAECMRKLGCEEALNLDGGGSSTLWMAGQIINSPCEGAERAMGNALVLVQKDRPAPAPVPKSDN